MASAGLSQRLGLEERAPRRLGWARIALYSAPALGVAAPSMFAQFYFLNFATDALLLAPATVGGILALCRVWDAISDPLVGYWSDRTRSRWGRRRPWLAISAPIMAATFVALWSPPSFLASPAALVLWSTAALFLFTSGFTAWGIPHQALAVELSDDAHVRTRIFGARFVVSLWGVALAFAAMQLVGNASDPRAMAQTIAWASAPALVAILLVPVVALRERSDFQQHPPSNPWRSARELWSNDDARRLLAIWFLTQLGMSSQGVIAPYMSTYVLKRPDLMGVLPALFIAPLIVSVPLWVALAGRFGRKRVWRAAMIGGTIAYCLLTLLPTADFSVLAVLLGTAGVFTGCVGPVGPSFFASLVDRDASESGERREGVIFAAKEFAEKASGAAVVLVVGGALQQVGFEPNVDQPPAVVWAIRACLGVFPGLALAGAAWLLRGVDDE